ncbi:MAG: glucose sorbosone dehydrogenase [Frankiales bacterium]|nr:glucose sorbosone dehydrogenase [Frankiales bacterium]
MPELMSHPRHRRAVVVATALLVAGGSLLAPALAAVPPGPATSAVARVRPAAAATATATPAATSVRLHATRVASGLSSPVLVRSADDGTSRLFVVEQAGRIRVVQGGRITGTYLDIRSLVTSGGERGMLGLAFAPDFRTSHRLFVTYTRSDGALVLARYFVPSASASRVSANTRKTLLVVSHPGRANHNGGDIAFGPDGYLYLGTGDGGGSGDPDRNAQNLRSRLGKMLRIDVMCKGHLTCVPPTNPFATSRVYQRFIWMSGLRNPWRWSFDTNGNQVIGDVGQNRYEEIDVVGRSRARGANLGWSCREAAHPYLASHCTGASMIGPTLELCHPDSVRGCPSSRAAEAIIGGYVYRGRANPAAVGTYVFGDYVTGRIWPLRGRTLGSPTSLPGVSGFGVDDNREIYAVTLSGGLYRITFTVA